MAWANEEIAGLLREYAELTQITGGDVFRARNYEKAARSVRGWADDISLLDLPSDHVRAARDAGVKFAIDSDTHSVSTWATWPTASARPSGAGSPRTT